MIVLLLLVCLTVTLSAEPALIQQYPLDTQLVYRIRLGTNQVTTVRFPSSITALEAAGVTSDPQTVAPVLLSHQPGASFFSLRALQDNAKASLNVVMDQSTYVLNLVSDPQPCASVTFYSQEESNPASQSSLSPQKLLNLLDRAKAYPLLKSQHPDLWPQVDHASPAQRSFYKDFEVEIADVYRFDPEDTLVFRILFFNPTEKEIRYLPQSLAIRVGSQIYLNSICDGSGSIPAAHLSSTNQLEPGVSVAFFAVTGTPDGRRNQLAVSNRFNLIVNRDDTAGVSQP